ncbi:T9SS type A sorting domain-containing protein [Dyadobacter sp. 32]|uniref:Ig-like domain-containing protein n=1 Tax=Dyadobacter sp. 32 TaxID=538966 RepID=UPI0011ED776E
MKRTFIKEGFFAIIATLFCAISSFAQTSITTGLITPASVCQGGSVSVAFTFAGTVLPTNSFVAQLSNSAGSFAAPVNIGTGAASPIAAVIPAGTGAGAAYKIRVVSVVTLLPTVPVVTGTESAVLTVKAVSPTPVVANPAPYQQGATALQLTATGTGLLWYENASGGTGVALAPTPLTTAIGTKSYYVTQTVAGSCESARAKIDVVVIACATAAPVVAAPVVNYAVGATATPLTATGTALKWYDVASGGVALAGAPTPLTTVAAIGTKSYYVSQTLNGCEGPRAKIDVVVTCATAAPVVAAPVVNYLVGATAVPLTATGAALKWYDVASGGAALAGAPTPLTTAAAIGTKSYYVSQTVNSCEGPRAKIDVTVTCGTALPTVTTPLNYFVGETAVALTATGTGLKWYNVPSGGAALPGAPIPSTAGAGTSSFYVSQTLNGCEGPRAEIKIIVNTCATPAPVVAAPVVNYLVGATATPLSATGTALKWYDVASGGVALGGAPTPLTTAAVIGPKSYYVSQTLNGCEGPRTKIDVIVTCGTAAPVIAAATVNYLVGATAEPLSATGTAMKWYTDATGGTALPGAPTPLTTAVGTTPYYVSQTLNGCEGPRAKIDVVVTCGTAKPLLNAPVVYCLGATAVPLTATGTGLKWYLTADAVTALPSAPTPLTVAAGTTTYYVSQTVNGCEGPREALVVTVNQTTAPAVLNLEYCQNATAAPLTAVGTGLKWYAAAAGGAALPAVPTPLTTAVGTTSYYVSQTLNNCEGPRAEIKVTVKALPAAPVVTAVSYCQNAPAVALVATGTGLKWYGTNATGGTATATAPIPATGATATYYVSQTGANGCEGPRAALLVTIKPLPGAPGTPNALVEYCQFVQAVPLVATPVATASLNWFGTQASGGTSSPVPPTPSTQDGGTTSYYVAQTLDGCIGDRAKIDVFIKTTPKPTTTTYFAFCQSASASPLTATGTNLKWYRQANSGDFQTTPFIPFTEKVEDYSFFVTQTGSNGCESPKEEIKIHIKGLPSATISGNVSIALGEAANIRLAFTSDGPWKYVLSGGISGNSDQANLDVQVKPITTTTYVVTEVSNACGKGVPIGSALVTVRVPTISTGIPSTTEACAGSTIQIPFQQSGTFPAGNLFVAQVSTTNEDAKFKAIPSVATSNQITATIPDTLKGGVYFVRIVSAGTNPDLLVKGSVASINLTVTPLPAATISGSKTILVGQTADLRIDFLGKAPWTFKLNDGTKDSTITATTTPYSFLLKPRVTTTYTVNSIVNVCGTVAKGTGSARIQVDPILGLEPAGVAFVKVYPTIVDDKCMVELDEPVSYKQSLVELIDLSGRTLTDKKINQKVTEMDLSKYPGGLYLIRVKNGNHTSVHRVMKQ